MLVTSLQVSDTGNSTRSHEFGFHNNNSYFTIKSLKGFLVQNCTQDINTYVYRRNFMKECLTTEHALDCILCNPKA